MERKVKFNLKIEIKSIVFVGRIKRSGSGVCDDVPYHCRNNWNELAVSRISSVVLVTGDRAKKQALSPSEASEWYHRIYLEKFKINPSTGGDLC